LNTYTLTAIARSSWGIPRTLEVVTGVKTNKIGEISEGLYKKYKECHEVGIKKEVKK